MATNHIDIGSPSKKTHHIDIRNQRNHIDLNLNGGFLKWGTTKSSTIMGFSIINIYKPSILGYPYDYGNPHVIHVNFH